MKKSLWMMAFVPFLLVGCDMPPGSLYPIYTEEDLIFVPEILGTWWSEGDPDDGTLHFRSSPLRFSSDDQRSYDLVIASEEEEEEDLAFSAHLIRIKGTMFLDLFPKLVGLADKIPPLWLPYHTFILVEQIEPTLKGSLMDGVWLESYLMEHPKSLRHQIIEDELVLLIASTKKLQAFLLKHVKTEGAFDRRENSIELTRQRPLPPEGEDRSPVRPPSD